ncbi:unnamed protein product [Scytosiphon promiscuus]
MRVGIVLSLLTTASICTRTLQARPERSVFGKKIRQSDVARVQQQRIDRLEERVQRMSADGAILAERSRQHREMRMKGSGELKAKVEELKAKLDKEKERTKKDFEEQLVAMREEMLAQATRDKDALEAELALEFEGERLKLKEEAKERATEIVEELKLKLAADAERDRELYAQRAALAEEGQELAREERNQLQEEKDQLKRQLEEMQAVEDISRKKIITKFKARENALRRNFEAQLREARSGTSGTQSPAADESMSSAWTSKRTRSTTSKVPPSTATASVRETNHRAAFKSSG